MSYKITGAKKGVRSVIKNEHGKIVLNVAYGTTAEVTEMFVSTCQKSIQRLIEANIISLRKVVPGMPEVKKRTAKVVETKTNVMPTKRVTKERVARA